jgi:hypothetical protein
MTGDRIVPSTGSGRSVSLGQGDPRERRDAAARVQQQTVREGALRRLRGHQLESSATLAQVIIAYNELVRAVTEGN